jgi:hypothetical protein
MAHIQVGDLTPRTQYTATTGGQATFTYTFPIFDEGDIKVYVGDVLLTTGYTVTNAGESAGGDVILTSAALEGTIVTLTRDMPVARESDYQTNGNFLADTLNDDFDKLTMMVQQVEEMHEDRTIMLSSSAEGSLGHIMGTKAERASKVISFGDDGDILLVNAFPTYREGWTVSTNYALNDLVKDTNNDNIYICIAAHTSTGTVPLINNAGISNWDLVVDLATVTTISNDLSDLSDNLVLDNSQDSSYYNIGFGPDDALSNLTTGYANTAMGGKALQFNTEGYKNTAFGSIAALANTTGNNNTSVGYFAGLQSIGSENTFVGSSSGINIKGDSNIAVGYNSGTTNPSTGSGNILIGNDLTVVDDTDNQLNIGNWITRDTTGSIQLTHGTSPKLFTTSTGINVTGDYVNSGGLYSDSNSSLKIIGGGNASNAGSNLTLYGGTNASAGTFRFRSGTSVLAEINSTGIDITGTVTSSGDMTSNSSRVMTAANFSLTGGVLTITTT